MPGKFIPPEILQKVNLHYLETFIRVGFVFDSSRLGILILSIPFS